MIGSTDPDRNITQVRVSSGSKRYGDVPYVKIGTNDICILKTVDATAAEYKSDDTEKQNLDLEGANNETD